MLHRVCHRRQVDFERRRRNGRSWYRIRRSSIRFILALFGLRHLRERAGARLDVLTHEPADRVDESAKLERFRQVVVSVDPFGLNLVKRLERPYQQNYRYVAELRTLFYELAQLITVLARHENIGQHQIRIDFGQLALRVISIADSHHLYAFIGESAVYDLLDCYAVIGE
jgi:hypothetical protein